LSIESVTHQELEQLLVGLLAKVDKRPELMADPSALMLVRLTTTLAKYIGEDSEDDELQAQGAQAESEAKAAAAAEAAQLKEWLADLTSKLAKAKDAADTRVAAVQQQLEVLQAELEASQALAVEAEGKLVPLRQKLRELHAKRAEQSDDDELALAEMKVKVLDYEYSARSTRVHFKGGQACPCCPECDGLDPSRAKKHKDRGHRDSCKLAAMIASL